MQFLAQAVQQHLAVLDHRVAFVLIGEGLFLRAFDRVLQQVVETTDACGFALLDQLRGAAGHEHRLHVGLGLRQIEQVAAVRVAAHLDEPPRLVVSHVRERAGRHVHERIAFFARLFDDPIGQFIQAFHRFRVTGIEFGWHNSEKE